MVSGIVYFNEIIENLKDATGIENMRPLYNRIRRFCYNCEIDIGAGGVVVLKKKEYTVGDGFYDGTRLRLPNDFVSEWSYGSLQNGIIQGNVYKFFSKGPTNIDFKYLGFLLDEEGNPFTTRNRLDAIIAYSVYRLYSSKYFIGTGNQNQYLLYKREYEDAVLAARGYDAFPSEQEWNELGAIRLGGTFEAMTDCGMKTFNLGTEDPSTIDTTSPAPDPTCIEIIAGISNGSATVTATISFTAVIQMLGVSNGSTSLTGWMQSATLIDFQLIGESNGSTTLIGALYPLIPVVQCDENFTFQGNVGTFSFRLDLGSDIGVAGILANPFSVPDRFRIEYNGVEVADSKFIGVDTYEAALLAEGYTLADMNLTPSAPAQVPVTFEKTTITPTFAIVYVDAPLGGTAWNMSGICPYPIGISGSSTVSGTLSAKITIPGSLVGSINGSSIVGILVLLIGLINGFTVMSANLTQQGVLAYTGAEGFGKYTVGGNGGTSIVVTNLNTSGAGSLVAALQTSGARYITFSVSGTIDFGSGNNYINVDIPNVTIDGSTAPNGGIAIKGAIIGINTSQVIIRHIRVRRGDVLFERDCISINANPNSISDIAIANVSMSWASDEIIAITTLPGTTATNITVQHCIMAEGLESDGYFSKPTLFTGNISELSFYKNFTAHNKERHVRADELTSMEIVNNVFYNAVGLGGITDGATFDMVNNHYKEGLDPTVSTSLMVNITTANINPETGVAYVPADSTYYITGNTNDFGASETDGDYTNNAGSSVVGTWITPDTVVNAIIDVLANAGATLPKRDSLDARYIDDYNNKTGNILPDSPTQTHVYPDLTL